MLEFLSDIHDNLLDPGRFLTALSAIVLTGIVGLVTGPRGGSAQPLYWQVNDLLTGWIGGKLDRLHRKAVDLLFRGVLFVYFALQIAYMFGYLAQRITAEMPLYGFTEILILSLLLTSGTVWFALLKLYFAMRDGKTGQGAYYAIARSSRVNLAVSDDYGITRTGMGLAARSFDKGIVAPVIWYLIAGLPGAFIYSALTAVVWRFGRDGSCRGFGKVALALEKLMGFVPHVLAGILMALAGLLTPTGGMSRALLALLHGKAKAPYAEGGLPVTAMAYALNVSLGGAVQDIDGHKIKRTWVGPEGATAQLEKGHLRRALYLSLMAHVLFLSALVGAMIVAGRLG
ncbi:MAG: cobalamin biosynthesis protein [Rhodospirillales bacterium]|nr:cobalamin biosynthesis protein [Rhodospirillales bacterium]